MENIIIFQMLNLQCKYLFLRSFNNPVPNVALTDICQKNMNRRTVITASMLVEK
jgi:hypothetical protein